MLINIKYKTHPHLPISKHHPKLTPLFPPPLSHTQNTITPPQPPPLLIQHLYYLQQISHFHTQLIPQPPIHPKPSAAFPTFTLTNHITQYTNPKIFSQLPKQTHIFAPFSTVSRQP
ncbi:catalase, partial [Staphylococcus epidermidis]|uniref:catalase n=1 Tax=Staphylococcus epidermidis TaxID=1282 RepID=UPI0011A21745